MIDPRILAATGLPNVASNAQIADGLRGLADLPKDGHANSRLWARFLQGVQYGQIGLGDSRGHRAQLANAIVEYAIVPPGEPGEAEFGTGPWDRELGVGPTEADENLRGLVFEEIAPRLEAASLYRLL
jgi:hypothetical protein